MTVTFEATRQDFINDLDLKVAKGITEQASADFLKRLVARVDNEEDLLALQSLATLYRRTGFVYTPVQEKTDTNVRYLQKDEEKSFDQGGVHHQLIVGDNYPALKNLLITRRGGIDVVYIDPPYGKDNMGAYADTNYDNAITRDNLLSMLHPRLVLARQLLADDGVIFCSIDDKNQAYVKGLFDEVFGEENFIACAPRKTGAGNAAASGDAVLRKPFDYLLIYKKSDACVLHKKIVGHKEYPYEDAMGKYMLGQFQATGSDSTRTARPNLYYPIYVLENNVLSLQPDGNPVRTILPRKVHGEDGRWMWSPEKFVKDSAQFLHYDGNFIQRKIYLDDTKDQTKYQVEQAWLVGSEYMNSTGTKLLKELFGDVKLFDNPKPVALVQWCLNLVGKKDAVVLDFFAGSGTTGHAVLDLNHEDGGTRQFILCTNNEESDGYIADTVTTKRLKRVMTGQCYDGTRDFTWAANHEPYGNSLDVYRIAQVSAFANATPCVFDVVDETNYGQHFDRVEDKVEWVCTHFQPTLTTVVPNSERD